MRKTKGKTRKISIIFIILILLTSVSAVLYASEPETTDIVCADINLYDALVEDLDDYVYRTDRDTQTIKIITSDISLIKNLNLTGNANKRITNLTGLEHFTSLQTLNLSGNSITSVEPISGITTLTTLNFSGNQNTITDISTLSSLVNLTNVNFSNSRLTNVDFMSTFTQLKVLNVSRNTISSLESIQGLSNLEVLDIANNANFNRFQSDIICHTNLKELDISGTGVQVLDKIETNLRNLEVLKVCYLDVELDPIVETYKEKDTSGKEVDVPYLDKLKVLDISYTTKSITFKQISYLTSLTDLYMVDVVGKWKNPDTTTRLSLSGLYELQNLNYINLISNNINDIKGMVYLKYDSNDKIEEKKVLGATQIYLQDNSIEDISYLTYLEKPIERLNLSYNKISDISALDSCIFTSNRDIDLKYQDIEIKVFKKSSVDQYMILPQLFQESKREGSIVYSENYEFVAKCNDIIDEASIKLNTEEIYLQPGNYNVIINKNKTKDDVLTFQLLGSGIATGSKIKFTLGTSSSYWDSMLFKDENLCEAIWANHGVNYEFDEPPKEAHLIFNLKNNEIKQIRALALSKCNISDLSGMENFTELTNVNLAENAITTIDQLQYCTDMLILNVSNNKLGNNNTAIQKMLKIQELDLANTEMTNIDSIRFLTDYWISKKRFPLTSLNISGNGFKDEDIYSTEEVTGIDKIASLTILSISNNQIQEINSLEPLKEKLSILDVSQNSVEDISVLSGFANLISLNLSNNKIKDISPISNCVKLSELDFSVNRVKDITYLSDITSSGTLVKLNMSNNQIDDVSVADKAQINQLLLAQNQKITQIISEDAQGSVTIQLPQIFIASNNTNSKFYDQDPIKISVIGKAEGTEVSEYCTLSSDGGSLVVDADKLTSEIIVAKIQGGNADNTTLAIAGPLVGTVTYNPSNEQPTNQDVIATIAFNRKATILNNNGQTTYKFTGNGEFTFEYCDEYGFEGTTTAIVNNIDKVKPEGNVTKEIVNKQVVVTIKLSEPINVPDGWSTPTNDKYSIIKTYSDDANETVKLVDLAGNETTVQVEVKIDKTVPVITGVQDGKKYNKSVTPVIEDENLLTVTLTKDGTLVSGYKSGDSIIDVGQYVLTATDKFENITTISFEIEVSDIITSNDEKLNIIEDNLTIKGIAPKTTLNNLKNKLLANMEYDILDKDGNLLSNTKNVGTGCKIKMANDKTYTLIVSGDCNGDAETEIRDILAINKHRLNKANLTNEFLLAGDVNGDGKADVRDILQINKFRLGKINEL